MDTNEKYTLRECKYCGNKTKLNILCFYLNQIRDDDYKGDTHYLTLQCEVCKNFQFAINHCGEDTQDYDLSGNNVCEDVFQIVYPHESYRGYSVPKSVSKAFKSVLKTKFQDLSICAIAIRRTLEFICKDNNATGNTLYEKINSLKTNGILPSMLVDLSDLLRRIGNIGAHDDTEFNNHQIEELIDLTKILIEYIYILPKRIKRIQSNIS